MEDPSSPSGGYARSIRHDVSIGRSADSLGRAAHRRGMQQSVLVCPQPGLFVHSLLPPGSELINTGSLWKSCSGRGSRRSRCRPPQICACERVGPGFASGCSCTRGTSSRSTRRPGAGRRRSSAPGSPGGPRRGRHSTAQRCTTGVPHRRTASGGRLPGGRSGDGSDCLPGADEEPRSRRSRRRLRSASGTWPVVPPKIQNMILEC